MMGQITKETIEFVNKAAEAFGKDSLLATFKSEENGLIALRWGFAENCMKVYELGEEIGLFTEWMDRPEGNLKRVKYEDEHDKNIAIEALHIILNKLDETESGRKIFNEVFDGLKFMYGKEVSRAISKVMAKDK